MCIKVHHSYYGCKHTANKTASGNTLAFVRPCPEALTDKGFNKPAVFSEEPEITHQYVRGQCRTCNLNQDLFWTKPSKKPVAATEPWKLEKREMTALTSPSKSMTAEETKESHKQNMSKAKRKRPRRQIWDSFGARIENQTAH